MRERAAAPTGYIPELDGLRGIAILMVMVHRMYPRLDGTPWPIEAGWAGVDLFFVISGFLIAGILIDTRSDPGYFKNFYARRVLRIFPLFYLLVGGMLIAFPLLGQAGFLEQSGSPLWYLFHLGNIPESLFGKDPPYWLAPVWSLAIEEQFYLTFPLLVHRVDPKRLARWLAVIAVFSVVMRFVTTAIAPDQERIQYLFTLCRLDTIALGCLLAVFVRSELYARLRPRLTSLLVPVIAVAGVILVITQLDRTTYFGRTLGYSVVAIAFVSLVLLVLEHRGKVATAVLRAKPLPYMGKLCFGLYLLHRPADTIVGGLAAKAGLDTESLLLLPVKIAVAVLLATVSWRLLESPFLRLKDRFTSRPRPGRVGALAVLLLAGCASNHDAPAIDAAAQGSDADGAIAVDATPLDAPPPGALGRVVYLEGQVHSPISVDTSANIAAIAATARTEPVFAKIGDSITATASFLTGFGGTGYDLGTHTDLAAAHDYFQAGNAAGTDPYARSSVAATGGWTTADALAGSPSPLDSELAAIQPRYGVVLFGTNDVRTGRTVDAFGADLWTLVDDAIAGGTIPILTTMPAMHGDPDSNARIPLFNRVVRAIAQGRSVPLIDLHLALSALPNEGISGDGIHPSVSPSGACQLTAAGLQYGYNVRNLVTLEALDRAHRARTGETLDATVTRRAGDGSHADPYRLGALPLTDLADTRSGELDTSSYCGVTSSGHEIVYRLDLTSAVAVDAYVVDRGAVDVDVAILDGSSACLAAGDATASATVGPGPAFIVVDSRAVSTEGEYLVVVQPH